MKIKAPFEFYTSSQLVEIIGRKAANLKEFLEIIKKIEDSSIFYHVHHAFREHQFAQDVKMAKSKIEEYSKIIRPQNFDEIMLLAGKVDGKRVKMVNSIAVGGGVAEILTRTVPLFNELGIKTKWDVIKGSGEFFGVTKAFHN